MARLIHPAIPVVNRVRLKVVNQKPRLLRGLGPDGSFQICLARAGEYDFIDVDESEMLKMRVNKHVGFAVLDALMNVIQDPDRVPTSYLSFHHFIETTGFKIVGVYLFYDTEAGLWYANTHYESQAGDFQVQYMKASTAIALVHLKRSCDYPGAIWPMYVSEQTFNQYAWKS